MTAICKSKTLRLLAAVLTLCLIVTLSAVSVFAEADAAGDDAATEAVTEAATDAATDVATDAATDAATEAGETSSEEATEGDASESSAATEDASASETASATAAATAAATESATAAAKDGGIGTTGLINLIVGGVILAVIIVLAIVFRKKIPGWYKGVKSECGKIVWCPKDKLKKNTLVVVIIIVALAVLIALLDLAFSQGIAVLKQLVS